MRKYRYTYFFLKAELKEAGLSSAARKASRAQIQKGIDRLPVSNQQKARDFMFQERLWGYWYCPEYKRPTEVLDRLFSPDIRFIYDTHSGGSHGGYLGLRILKDQPDQVHPNPRADPRSHNIALAGSIRILLEAMNIRDHFENAGAHWGAYQVLLNHLVSLRPASQGTAQ